MDYLQNLFDGMSMQWQKERATSQMTLGEMIDRLQSFRSDQMVAGIANPHSYRGYYIDLAFEPLGERMPAADALEVCKSCMGATFEGYKGGDYDMGSQTPVWISNYGTTGEKLISIKDDGTFETGCDD